MMKGSQRGAWLAVLALAFGQSACTTMSLVETKRDGVVPVALEHPAELGTVVW